MFKDKQFRKETRYQLSQHNIHFQN